MLILGDCHRRIELDFSLSTAYTRKESLAKADQLFEVIKAFHEGLHAEAKLIEIGAVARPSGRARWFGLLP